MKKYKIYDIKDIKNIYKKISSTGKLFYWVQIDVKKKRITQEYFFLLKNKNIRVSVETTQVRVTKKCVKNWVSWVLRIKGYN